MTNSVVGRPGEIVTIKGRSIPFSFHPVTRSTRRYGLQSRIFSTNPWGIIRQSIEDEIGDNNQRAQSLSFLEQAENFYNSAKLSTVVAAKPLLFYYCFLNIAKSFCIKSGVRASYEKAKHGLQEEVHPGGKEFDDSFVKAFKAKPNVANIFDDLRKALRRPSLPGGGRVYDLKYLAPQLLQGHRVWCDAADQRARYKPYHFDKILSGRFGGHIQEIISNIPQQFLYLLASEFSDREIAHAPIVP